MSLYERSAADADADASRSETNGERTYSKRTFLRRLGAGSVSGAIAAGGLGQSTGRVRASLTSSDGDSCSCSYEDDEWNSGVNEIDSAWGWATSADISGWSNPGWTGIDVCHAIDPDNDDDSLCITTFDEVTETTASCAGGRTMYTFGATVSREDLFAGTVVWSYDVWVGIDEYGCLWLGTSSGQCTNIDPDACDIYDAWYVIADTADDVRQWAEDAANWFEDEMLGYEPSDAVHAVIVAGFLIVLIAVIGAATLAPGVAPPP